MRDNRPTISLGSKSKSASQTRLADLSDRPTLLYYEVHGVLPPPVRDHVSSWKLPNHAAGAKRVFTCSIDMSLLSSHSNSHFSLELGWCEGEIVLLLLLREILVYFSLADRQGSSRTTVAAHTNWWSQGVIGAWTLSHDLRLWAWKESGKCQAVLRPLVL